MGGVGSSLLRDRPGEGMPRTKEQEFMASY